MKKIVAVDFVTLGPPLQPSPPLAANWPLIGTKLNCRRPFTGFKRVKT